MGRFTSLLRRIFKGTLACAIEDGLKVGKNVTDNGGCNFGSEPYLITLEDNVRLSGNVTFITHDGGNYAFRYKDEYKDVNHFGKIHIEEHSFIGANCTIMPGVRIGKNCVIGAGSVVTKSVPAGCIAAGIPARVIGHTEDYAEKMKRKMPSGWNVNAYKANKREYLTSMIPDPEPAIEEDEHEQR